MAAVEYSLAGEDGAAPEVRLRRAGPAWRVLATVVAGVLLLAAVAGAIVSSSPKIVAAPRQERGAVHGPRAQMRRPTRLNKVFALYKESGLHKTVSLQAAAETHSVQDDVAGASDAAAGGGGPPSFADIDGDGDGIMTFSELKDFTIEFAKDDAYFKSTGQVFSPDMWADIEPMIKAEFESADANNDGGLDEDEFTAATQPGSECASHGECPSEVPFCYDGHCASCDECHYCWDGVDGTCGTCGAGFPTKEDATCGWEATTTA